MKKSRILTTVILTILIITIFIPKYKVSADPGEDLETQIQILDNNISKSTINIGKIKTSIEDAQIKMGEKEKEIESTQKDMEKQEELLSNRLSAWYKSYGNNRVLQYIEIFAKTENFSEIFDRIESINRMNKLDKKVVHDLEVKKKELDRDKEELSALKNKCEEEKVEAEKQLALLEENKKDITAKLEAYKKEQERIRAEEERKRLEELKNNGGKYPAVDVPATGNAKDIIDLALSFRGVPYVWGGESPSGFDCSGLVQYCFGKYGYKLPRVAEDQQDSYQRVAVSEIIPGDLIFWGDPAHHVAIYIGNGQYVHAPQTGDVVKISSLAGKNITSAVRVVR